jgi:hypothetical protein
VVVLGTAITVPDCVMHGSFDGIGSSQERNVYGVKFHQGNSVD